MIRLVPIADVAADAVEALLDRAFGPDRRGKTAYRIRAGLAAIPDLSFAALSPRDALVGTIQCWPVEWRGNDGTRAPLVMVGPIAVEPAVQSAGLGRRLTRHALAIADASPDAGLRAQMLVGDPEYYARFFGFSDAGTTKWRLPGPFEPRRLLARGPVPTAAGSIEPRALAPA